MSESTTSSNRSASRKSYPSDVSNRQWEQIDLLLPADAVRGRHREYSLREIVNAINYRWLTGCSWRMLPHDLPHWQTVYGYFRRWQRAGLLSPLREILISRSLRMSPPSQPKSCTSDRPTTISPTSTGMPVTLISDHETSSSSMQPSYSYSRS